MKLGKGGANCRPFSNKKFDTIKIVIFNGFCKNFKELNKDSDGFAKEFNGFDKDCNGFD